MEFARRCLQNKDKFQDVIWSDESSVQLETHRRRCCRQKGQPPKSKPRAEHPVKVHVSAGISLKGATQIQIFDGIMTSEV